MIFPVGLGIRLRQWPLVTIGVSVSWIVVFAMYGTPRSRLVNLLTSVPISSDQLLETKQKTTRNLFYEYCRKSDGTPQACKRYSIIIEPDYKDSQSTKEKELSYDKSKIILKELSDCDSSKTCLKYKYILESFLENYQTKPTLFKSLPSFESYSLLSSRWNKMFTGFQARLGLLSKNSFNLLSAFYANFWHGSYMHLFFNLITFIIFGIYAEQRYRRSIYLIALFFGGTVGISLQALFFSAPDAMVFGGSAMASTALGLFYIFFFHQRMKLVLWYGLSYKIFHAHIKYTLPILFLISDIAGSVNALTTHLKTSNAPNVAHFAHLGSFFFGVIAALIIISISRLKWPFIYQSEVKDFQKLLSERDPVVAFSLGEAILRYNPENILVMEQLSTRFLDYYDNPSPLPKTEQLESKGIAFLKKYLQSIIAMRSRRNEQKLSCHLLNRLPVTFIFNEFLGNIGHRNVLKLAIFAESNCFEILSIKLYSYFLDRFPSSNKRTEVLKRVERLIATLPVNENNCHNLELFSRYHPQSHIINFLSRWISQTANLERNSRVV